jgi:hypothetical protein
MRFIFAIFACLALMSARASDQPTAPNFSSYLQNEGFRSCLDRQTNAARHVHHILAITKFSGAGSVANEYELTDGGVRIDYAWSFPPGVAVGNANSSRLSETQLKMLISAIRRLPATNASPPIDDLVLVSFCQGTNWVTCSYDKRSPPEVLVQIREIQRAAWVPNFTVQ